MKRPKWPAALLFAAVLACGDRQSRASDSASGVDTAPKASSTRDASNLEQSARRMVAFLRGEVPFDPDAVADTVELRVAPEGGGAVRRVSRDALREPSAWTIASPTQRFRLVPPPAFSKVSAKVGRHFNCQEQDLATRAPDLALRPHVGVRLEPAGAESCLKSWNATFVFDTAESRPRLIAVVYDQWEW